jgi:superoxide dismutase, Fe-Mn family
MRAEQVGWDPRGRQYILPELSYEYGDLEPHIDAMTMELHHSRHHQSYVRGANTALERLGEIREGRRDEAETARWTRQLAFHGSGHLLHTIFWHAMAPTQRGGGGRPSGLLAEHLERDFGSYERFEAHFKNAAEQVEGNGWAILVFEPTSGRLMILQAEKHQNLAIWGVVPLLPVDVWEHAYYIRYQNRRREYLDNFMQVVNWPFITRHYTGLVELLHPVTQGTTGT